MMKISIITPSYNQGEFIEQNINSVLSQDYDHYEHIVVDGGSKDQTVDILQKYPSLIWVSEKDNGQADALSKGFNMSTGDIIGWINSDDYYEPNIFKLVLEQFEDPKVNWIVGNLTRVFEQTNKTVPDHSPLVTYEQLLDNPDIVRQQCTFFRRQALQDVGLWDASFYMVMDYDLWIRLAKLNPPKMLGHNLAYFRFHEAQKTSHGNIL